MTRVRFIAPARREFLAEVAYYNGKEPGLGARFAAAVEEATARAVAFPSTGSPASKNTRRVFIKDFPIALVYRPEEGESLLSRSRITLAVPTTGKAGFRSTKAMPVSLCETRADQ